VERAFGPEIDYALLIKQYGIDDNMSPSPTARRYSPNKETGEEVRVIKGDPKGVSTSYIERQNLTMRMGMRRFTRLTNAFSKKFDNHAHAVALHFMYMNFARPHKSLANPYPRTPAMAAGLAGHIWTCEEIAATRLDVEKVEEGQVQDLAVLDCVREGDAFLAPIPDDFPDLLSMRPVVWLGHDRLFGELKGQQHPIVVQSGLLGCVQLRRSRFDGALPDGAPTLPLPQLARQWTSCRLRTDCARADPSVLGAATGGGPGCGERGES
jgi:hypothetical protein